MKEEHRGRERAHFFPKGGSYWWMRPCILLLSEKKSEKSNSALVWEDQPTPSQESSVAFRWTSFILLLTASSISKLFLNWLPDQSTTHNTEPSSQRPWIYKLSFLSWRLFHRKEQRVLTSAAMSAVTFDLNSSLLWSAENRSSIVRHLPLTTGSLQTHWGKWKFNWWGSHTRGTCRNEQPHFWHRKPWAETVHRLKPADQSRTSSDAKLIFKEPPVAAK